MEVWAIASASRPPSFAKFAERGKRAARRALDAASAPGEPQTGSLLPRERPYVGTVGECDSWETARVFRSNDDMVSAAASVSRKVRDESSNNRLLNS